MLATIERPDGFTDYRWQHFSLFSLALSQVTCQVCGHFENIPFTKRPMNLQRNWPSNDSFKIFPFFGLI